MSYICLIKIFFNLLVLNKLVTCERFLYFAYGSNMLARRIHISNPSAVLDGVGKLENHRLDFIKYSKNWNGAAATIVEDPEADVWGSLWMLDIKHMATLDRQEGVDVGWYFPKTVNVTKINGTVVSARTYEQTITPSKLKSGETLPPERQPSNTYHKVIVVGAIECGLPENYIRKLTKIPHNRRNGKLARRKLLGPEF